MSVKRYIGISIVLAGMLMTAIQAEGRHHHVFNQEKLQKTLSLSPAQVEKVNAINKRYKRSYLTHAESLTPIELKIKKARLDDTVDYNQIKQLLRDAEYMRTEMKVSRMQHHDEIKGVLTTDQQTKFRKMNKRKRPGSKDRQNKTGIKRFFNL